MAALYQTAEMAFPKAARSPLRARGGRNDPHAAPEEPHTDRIGIGGQLGQEPSSTASRCPDLGVRSLTTGIMPSSARRMRRPAVVFTSSR